MLRLGIATLCSIAITLCLCPIVLSLVKKLKVGQPILGYVTNHYSKSGTPTMGGLAFLIGACAVSVLSFVGYSNLAVTAAVATLGFGVLGFLDDFLKVKRKDNGGLSVIQKLVGQILLSLIIAYFAYQHPYVGSVIKIPFTDITLDLGVWALPVYAIFIVGVTNFVNLTDGLDGLVSTSGSLCLISYGILVFLSSFGLSVGYCNALTGLSGFAFCLGGALAVFYVLNSYPAKIFMGDTGSLGVGAGIACVGLFSRNLLLFFILGIVYCVSGLSVILQVSYFKLTGKRIFKMAPFHHHLERCGLHENKIVAVYALVTMCAGIAVISFWG